MAVVRSVRDASRDQQHFSEVKDWFNKNLAPDAVNLDDQRVYENVYHDGRWAGVFQCIDENAAVAMSSGTTKRLGDIVVDDDVICYDALAGEFVSSSVDAVFDHGLRECIELTFDSGQTLTCTPDHLLLTQTGWVRADSLTDDHEVVDFSIR